MWLKLCTCSYFFLLNLQHSLYVNVNNVKYANFGKNLLGCHWGFSHTLCLDLAERKDEYLRVGN